MHSVFVLNVESKEQQKTWSEILFWKIVALLMNSKTFSTFLLKSRKHYASEAKTSYLSLSLCHFTMSIIFMRSYKNVSLQTISFTDE